MSRGAWIAVLVLSASVATSGLLVSREIRTSRESFEQIAVLAIAVEVLRIHPELRDR